MCMQRNFADECNPYSDVESYHIRICQVDSTWLQLNAGNEIEIVVWITIRSNIFLSSGISLFRCVTLGYDISAYLFSLNCLLRVIAYPDKSLEFLLYLNYFLFVNSSVELMNFSISPSKLVFHGLRSIVSPGKLSIHNAIPRFRQIAHKHAKI